jgi:hypothetical protein
MGVAPDSSELLRLSAEVNLLVEEICDRYVIEFNANAGHLLLDGDELPYKKQVIRVSNAKATYFVI